MIAAGVICGEGTIELKRDGSYRFDAPLKR
jgi:hypothetical protein